MNYLKIALIIVCLFIFVWLGYKLGSDSGESFEDVIDSYRVENPKIVEENLKKFKDQIPQAQYLLYEAYLARKENDLVKSSEQLEEASKKVVPQIHNPIILEIVLNQALNAYLKKDKLALETAVEKAASLDDNNGWVLFFKGLLAFEKGECAVTLNLWTKDEERLGLSYWMRLDFSSIFSPTWIKLHLARCEIHEGMILQARELLEGQRNLLKGAQLDEVNFLLGYSYIVEGEKKSPQETILLYKQAFSYFSRIPIQDPLYAHDRALIQSIITEKALEMIYAKQLHGLQEYLIILNQWKAYTTLEKISQEVALSIHRLVINEHFQEVFDIANILNTQISSGSIRDNFGKSLEAELENGIKTETPKQLDVEIRVSKLFTSNVEIFSRRITQLLTEQLLQFHGNDPKKISAYIKLFNLLSLDEQALNALTETLIQKGIQEWNNGRYPQAISFFKGSLALLSGQSQVQFQKQIALQLSAAYQKSFIDDDIEQLSHILKASNALAPELIQFQDQKNVNYALNKAEELYKEKKYPSALKKAKWVLTLDSHQYKALSILAMSLYHLGDFQEAYVQFQKLTSYTPEEITALGIVLPLSHHVVEAIDLQENLLHSNFEQQFLWNLTLAYLLDEQFELALKWSTLVHPVTDELLLIKLYALYSLGQWERVVEFYQQLTPSMQSFPIIKSFMASAYLFLDNREESQRYLRELPDLQNPSINTTTDSLYSTFLKQKIIPFNGNSSAALFYEQSEHDPSKALDYLNKITNPSSEILLKIALLEKKQGKIFQAKTTLKKALTLLNGTDDEENVRAQILIAMGQLLMISNAYPEAVDSFQAAFTLLQPTNHPINDYALALMGMQRYDLALEEWTKLSQKNPLSLTDEINMAECLIHLKDFNSVNALAKKIAQGHSTLSLVDRLRLARLMLISNNSYVFKILTEKLTTHEVSTLPEMVQLIQLMMEMGDMVHAWIYASDFRDVLINHAEGCLLLAELMMRSENLPQAIQYAEFGYQLEPWNNQLTLFLIKHLPKDASLHARVKKEYKENPEKPTPLLNYVYLLIERDLNSKAPLTDEINTAIHVLKNLTEQNSSIPWAYALLGAANLLAGRLEEANEALMTCLHLDPSNIMAYQYLSILYQYIDNEEPTVPLITALLFAPSDPELWEQLSILYQRKEDALDSQEALKKVMRFYPLRIVTRLQYAELQMELQNLEDSKQTLESVLDMDAKNVRALKLLLKILYDPTLTLNQEKASIIINERKTIYERLHALDPESAEALKKQFFTPLEP